MREHFQQSVDAYTASIGGFSLGASLGWSSPALSSLQDRGDFGVLDGTEETWMASSVAVNIFERIVENCSVIIFNE